MNPSDLVRSHPRLVGPRATPAPAGGSCAARCRVAAWWKGGTQYRGALAGLLLGRLRVVSLIALAPTAAFLLRKLLIPDTADPVLHLSLFFHAVVTAVLLVLAGLLWRGRDLSYRGLRLIELALFGSLAVFFAWLQVHTFHLDVACGCAGLEGAEALELPRVVIRATAIRWFFLIVCYGVFIPSTWRRCALVTALAALLPLLLTLVAALLHDQLTASVALGLFDLATLCFTASAVAVFGSYRLQVLQEQAFEAQQLGQYRLKRTLGGGGMGEVYLAEHVLLRRPCAIKLIRPQQAGDPTTLQRFEREVQAMALLTHPNNVEVYDYGHADDGTFYYVMEYLPGLSLEALVARHGPQPAGRVIHLMRQVCAALREAHGAGLLHRDIKPSNILVCERGGVPDVAKLLDFGLVHDMGLGREATRLTVLGTVLGSPPYMSPEQAAGRTDLDARTDIYSLGGVIYYLMTGQPPFPRETAMQMLLAHAYEAVVPPSGVRPGVPSDLEAVVLRCLQKKPEARFPDVVALAHALACCHDAESWTEEQAAVWWGGLEGGKETQEHAVAGAETPA